MGLTLYIILTVIAVCIFVKITEDDLPHSTPAEICGVIIMMTICWPFVLVFGMIAMFFYYASLGLELLFNRENRASKDE